MRRRSSYRQNGRQNVRRPKYDLLVAGLLRVSREKTSPICAGIQLERRRVDSKARGSFCGIRDYDEGIPRRDRSGRCSAVLNRPRASANRNPAFVLTPTRTMPHCNTLNVGHLWLHYVSHRLVTKFSRSKKILPSNLILQIDVLPIGGTTAQQMSVALASHPSCASQMAIEGAACALRSSL